MGGFVPLRLSVLSGGGGAVNGSGSGATNRIAIWANGTTLTSDANLVWASNTLTIAAGGLTVAVGGATSFLLTTNSADALSIDSNQRFVFAATGNAQLHLMNGSLNILAQDNLPLTVNGQTGAGSVRFLNPAANGKYNWLIGGQFNLDQTFEITPSTAANGTTFSTPLFSISQGGKAIIGASGGTAYHDVFGRGFNITYPSSGVTCYVSLAHTSNSANSGAHFYAQVAGASAGDPAIFFNIVGATDWGVGVRNSASDAFQICNSSALGTNIYVSIQTGGQVTLGASGGSQAHQANGTLTITSQNNFPLAVVGQSSAGSVRFLNPAASGKYNWLIGAQINLDNTWELTPSTAADGSTFSAPVFSATRTGLITIGAASDTTTDHAINGNTEAAAGAVAEYWQVTFNGATRKIAMLATA